MIEYLLDIIIILNLFVLYEPMKAVIEIISEDKEIDFKQYDNNIYLALIINFPLIFIK